MTSVKLQQDNIQLFRILNVITVSGDLSIKHDLKPKYLLV